MEKELVETLQNYNQTLKDIPLYLSKGNLEEFRKLEKDSLNYFEKYKFFSIKYEDYLNSQDKSLNPFLNKSIYVPLEFYKPLYCNPVDNLKKIYEYTSLILMDFIRLKESHSVKEGFFDRLNWRTSMVNHYISNWLLYRGIKSSRNVEGGIGEEIAPYPEETSEVPEYIKDRYSSENDEFLENKKLSILRKMNVCSKKLIELSPKFEIKLEVKLNLLWKKYKRVLESYRYESDI